MQWIFFIGFIFLYILLGVLFVCDTWKNNKKYPGIFLFTHTVCAFLAYFTAWLFRSKGYFLPFFLGTVSCIYFFKAYRCLNWKFPSPQENSLKIS